MSTKAWMPFYVGDYVRDTAHLTTEEHGAYLLLILHYWVHGRLPDDEAKLKQIARTSKAKWRRMSGTLSAFFVDGWRHKRVEAELAKAKTLSSKRKIAGKQGGSKSRAKAEQLLPPSPSPSNTYSHEGRAKITQSWKPNAASIQHAFLKGIHDVDAETETFVNHCLHAGTESEDFQAYFRKWCSNSISERKRYVQQTGGQSRKTGDGSGIVAAGRKLLSELREREESEVRDGAGDADVRLLPSR